MVVRKFNYYRFATFLVIVIGIISGIIFGVVKLVNNYKYKQSYDYKLSLVGYKEDEVKRLQMSQKAFLIEYFCDNDICWDCMGCDWA